MNSLGHKVTIHGLTMARTSAGDGRRTIAFFDFEATGFLIRGCQLIRTGNGGLTISPPRFDERYDTRKSIEFIDNSLREAIKASAVRAYSALGGDDLPPLWANAGAAADGVTRP